MRLKFFLDENVPPEIAEFFQSLRHDADGVLSRNLRSISDDVVLDIAVKEGRILVTFDKGFEKPIERSIENPNFGVILLKIKPKTIENTKRILKRLLSEVANKRFPGYIITANNYRWTIREI